MEMQLRTYPVDFFGTVVGENRNYIFLSGRSSFWIPYSTIVLCHFVHFLTFSYSISIYFKSREWILKVSHLGLWSVKIWTMSAG